MGYRYRVYDFVECGADSEGLPIYVSCPVGYGKANLSLN